MLHKRAQGGLQQWAKAWGSYEWQALTVIRTKDKKKKIQKWNTRVCCPPTNMGKKKSSSYIITLHLVKYKCANIHTYLCISMCIYIYIYMVVQESVTTWVSILQLVTEKVWSSRWKGSQEKDHRIWGTVKYHLETKFKIQHVHFHNKNVIFIHILKRYLWGFIVFLQSSTGSFHNRMNYDI